MSDIFSSVGATLFSIGLTGGIGSGKTTVANLFGERGAALIDTDAIAHQLTTPGGVAINAIRTAFGDSFIGADGAMDRARMRAHVFADAAARKRLEAVLHPLIRSETARAAQAARGDYLIFVVPLLVESQQWRTRTSRILVVDCSEDVQIARVMQRNGMTRAQVEAIMAAQATRAERLAAADDVIENNGDAAALLPQIERLHALYLSMAKTNRDGHL
ncbi:dephospho-CoA kinase [Herbaspirillum hiltneri N3]|uniref:Dephospho-CoA kinase n=1 Tax=Herbaspirillum hiltneri N3 TaxID=1262470 RepID=A0ABN4HQX3_9BURK|nr:dephospho-CoA kinase [Herbaspirillum hiltneri]AKZ61365.1 dephospho-CoA kinase [Herbaspirillum hiltneri N3]